MESSVLIPQHPSMIPKNNVQFPMQNSKVNEKGFLLDMEMRKFQGLRSQTESLTNENHSTVSTHPDRHRDVDLDLIRTGLLRLHLLLQCSPPGSVPDPQFLSNLLFLVGLILFLLFLFNSR